MKKLAEFDLTSNYAKGVDFDHWFIRMRWIATGVAGALVVLIIKVLHLLDQAAFWPLLGLVVVLAATNLFYEVAHRRRWLGQRLPELQIISDLVVLTAMVHFSGGLENALSFAYTFHIIIAGILLKRWQCYLTVGLALTLLSCVALGEMVGWLHHYTLLIFPHEGAGHYGHPVAHASHKPLFVFSLLGLQAVLMSMTAYFTVTIVAQLREEQREKRTVRQRLERVVEATGAGFMVVRPDLRVAWMNARLGAWLDPENASPSEEVTRDWIGGAEGPAAQTLVDGRVRKLEREWAVGKSGHRVFQVSVAPIMDSAGQVSQVVELTQDITEGKMLEAEMVHRGKMALLGSIAAGVAHEVGNPLASMSARLSLLEEDQSPQFLGESLTVLNRQIGRIDRIVQGISQFARPTRGVRDACDVNGLVTETFNIIRFHRLARAIEWKTELDPALPDVTAVRDQLVQIFLNLGLNALDAMPDGGALTVRTRREEGVIAIDFLDTGPGIAPDVIDRIFDPFFSTKEDGVGIGLSIAFNIAKAHGGELVATHRAAGGACLTLTLPLRSTPDDLAG